MTPILFLKLLFKESHLLLWRQGLRAGPLRITRGLSRPRQGGLTGALVRGNLVCWGILLHASTLAPHEAPVTNLSLEYSLSAALSEEL